ncbi:DUF3450 domain-containing protein [bacterium]|jgi:hypothetical protein|nr:DUF3450 domain-containing protein [bacterium]MBT4291234.1 DUF3450 domain-containing protein [bacterium]MBT7310982.1 DUF3450 domain-containing protein [bacterium]
MLSRITVLILLLAGNLFAQGDVQETVSGTIEIQKQTQQSSETWSAEKSALDARYRSARSDVEYLTKRRDLALQRRDAMQDRADELTRRLAESKRLRESLVDTLGVLLTKLDSAVTNDLPFLEQERSIRLESLSQELARPDFTSAEKLRRLLEAFQVEAGYGSTVEVYPTKIRIDEQELSVDVLRIGRLSLFWMTPDQSMCGDYNVASGNWEVLENKYNRSISRAMEMATRMRPVELINLPLGKVGS